MKKILLKQLHDIVSVHLKSFEIKVYGSYATNLSLPWSDIDLVLSANLEAASNSDLTVDPLDVLNGILTNPLQKSWVSSCKLIKTASTPIIKLVSTEDFE